MKKDWTEKMTNKSGAAAEFLKPFGDKSDGDEIQRADGDSDTDNDPDYLDRMLKGSEKKEELHLHGLYLEPEISKLLNKLARQGGRGAKSRITNDAFRKYFRDKGLLK